MELKFTELTDHVYSQLKSMIFNRQLRPGDKLVQEKLAAELGVSRSPLLKALARLENELLVESIPRRGMYVKKMSAREMVDVYECRAAIEGLAAKLVAERAQKNEIKELGRLFEPFHYQHPIDPTTYETADHKFHSMIIVLSENKIIKRLEMLGNIHLIASQIGLVRPPEETLPEHDRIIGAMESGNASLAETAMREHIQSSAARIKIKNNLAINKDYY